MTGYHWRLSAVLWPTTLAALFLPWATKAQTFNQQGYLETMLTVYPQTAPNDSGQFIDSWVLDWEPSVKWSDWRFNAGFDAQFDSHRMAQRTPAVSYLDRETQRPAFDVTRLSVSWGHGPVTIEIGKQFVRWGKTDILNPTDHLAPRDYLTVIDANVLAVTAARLTIASQSDSLDLVYSPFLTPSRIPLLNQRWVVVPEEAQGFPLIDGGADYPGGGQYGARWNHMARYLEYSFSYFHGFNNLPLLQGTFEPALGAIDIRRSYAELDSVGTDAAIPLPWFTIKAESAFFHSNTPQVDQYVLYVLQAERQSGEWLFVAGYVGEYVTDNRNEVSFDPERGLAKAFVGRASWTIDTRRSLVFEGAARQNGEGFYGKVEYSQSFGQHWRLTPRIGVIRGSDTDFLGQFHRNSFASLAIRYSF
jgi:hypothetical protein